VQDDQLRLIFTCCHPALAQPTQVALTLRLVAGLQTPEIARAFLVPEPTMAQRLVRAQAQDPGSQDPHPGPRRRAAPRPAPGRPGRRLPGLQRGVRPASSGPDLVRDDLCAEAVRLARLLHQLMPDEPEAIGLLGLLLLTAARRPARTGPNGSLVRLPDQDRRLWDAAMIREGQGAGPALPAPQPGPAPTSLQARDRCGPQRRAQLGSH